MTPEINPRLLMTFREVAVRGSMSAAARELGWTQPALGQQMRRLEQEVGAPLLSRSSKGIELTALGELLLAHAEAISGRLNRATKDVQEALRSRGAVLRLAAFPTASAAMVAPAMAELSLAERPVDVRLTQLEPPEAAAALLAGDVDAALVFSYEDVPEPDLDPSLRSITLGAEPVAALVPAGSAHSSFGFDVLAGARWVGGCPRCRAHLVATAGRHGFVPDIRHSTDDYIVTQGLVAAGVGVSLVPHMAVRVYRHPGVDVVLLPDEAPRTISLLVADGDGRWTIGVVERTLRRMLADDLSAHDVPQMHAARRPSHHATVTAA